MIGNEFKTESNEGAPITITTTTTTNKTRFQNKQKILSRKYDPVANRS